MLEEVEVEDVAAQAGEVAEQILSVWEDQLLTLEVVEEGPGTTIVVVI